MKRVEARFGAISTALMLACSDVQTSLQDAGAAEEHTSGGRNCSPTNMTTGSPETINDLLELVNGLPHPVELPCLIESLDRPIAINSNFNTQSAQPAMGRRSPRIFIITSESFAMSLVPGGQSTLEFGERSADGLTSVKGELHFPIEGPLNPEDAFARLAPDEATGLTLDQATKCGVCHDHERRAPDYPSRGAFASAVLRPAPFFAVELAAIKREHDACDSEMEPQRCSELQAIFERGEVVQAGFP